jgi:hypothetical protein
MERNEEIFPFTRTSSTVNNKRNSTVYQYQEWIFLFCLDCVQLSHCSKNQATAKRRKF